MFRLAVFADVAFVSRRRNTDPDRRGARRDLEARVDPAEYADRAGAARRCHVHLDLYERPRVHASRLQHLCRCVRTVWTNAHRGIAARLHGCGLPHHGLRDHLHDLVGRRQHGYAVGQHARAVVRAWSVALRAIGGAASWDICDVSRAAELRVWTNVFDAHKPGNRRIGVPSNPCCSTQAMSCGKTHP